MEIPDQETIAQEKKSNSYGKMAVAFIFLFSLLWSLGAFLVWLLLGCICYFSFLYFYYRPRTKTSRFRQQRQNYRSKSGPIEMQEKVKRIIRIVVVSAIGIFFSLFIIGLFFGDPETASYPEKQNTSEEINAQAINFYEEKEYDSALFYCDKVLATEVNNSTALYYKGMVYYDQEKYDDALLWFKKAYDAGLRDAFLSHVLAYLYDEKQNTLQALIHYKEALQMDSSRADIYTRLAELEPTRAEAYKKLEQKWKK
jgi:tetratricopeptide (TPR) repeat protein